MSDGSLSPGRQIIFCATKSPVTVPVVDKWPENFSVEGRTPLYRGFNWAKSQGLSIYSGGYAENPLIMRKVASFMQRYTENMQSYIHSCRTQSLVSEGEAPGFLLQLQKALQAVEVLL